MMDDLSDWFIIPPVSSLDPTDGSSTEKTEPIYVSADEENISESSSEKYNSPSSIFVINGEEVKSNSFDALSHHKSDVTTIPSQLPNLVINRFPSKAQCSRSQLFNKSSQMFSKECHLNTEKTLTKQDVLQQTVDVSTNTELQDTSTTNFSDTSDSRKLSKTTDQDDSLLGVKNKSKSKDYQRFNFPPFSFQEERYHIALKLCLCIFMTFILFLNDSFPKPPSVTSLNDTITALQTENLLLKRQIFVIQRKENRKISILHNLVSRKSEEKENITTKYLQQLELETLYLKKISHLEEEVSSLETKYKVLQNRFTESNSTLKENDKNHEKFAGPSSNNETHDVKKKRKEDGLFVYVIILPCIMIAYLYIAAKMMFQNSPRTGILSNR